MSRGKGRPERGATSLCISRYLALISSLPSWSCMRFHPRCMRCTAGPKISHTRPSSVVPWWPSLFSVTSPRLQHPLYEQWRKIRQKKEVEKDDDTVIARHCYWQSPTEIDVYGHSPTPLMCWMAWIPERPQTSRTCETNRIGMRHTMRESLLALGEDCTSFWSSFQPIWWTWKFPQTDWSIIDR